MPEQTPYRLPTGTKNCRMNTPIFGVLTSVNVEESGFMDYDIVLLHSVVKSVSDESVASFFRV